MSRIPPQPRAALFHTLLVLPASGWPGAVFFHTLLRENRSEELLDQVGYLGGDITATDDRQGHRTRQQRAPFHYFLQHFRFSFRMDLCT